MGSYASQHCVIAIDGPAASGKSSVARKLARQLGFVYVNSGAIYRAITWHFLQTKIRPEESERIAESLDSAVLTCVVREGEARIVVDDLDPAVHLRDDRVNESVSRVSKLPRVREIVSQRLHDCAEVRLRRRAAQGERDEITVRDRDDVSRAVSPLVKAKDAHVIDTSYVTVEQVVTEIITRLEQVGLPISDVQITDRALGE